MHDRFPTSRVGVRADDERGVSLVEVVVVVVIIAILVATVLAGKNSTKRAGAVTAARAAGASYHDAIEAFMRDHGGRTPIWNNTDDWPANPPPMSVSGVTTPTGTPPGAWGPLNTGARRRPYLDAIPEAVVNGRVEFVNAGTGTTQSGVRSRVVYQWVSARRYRLLVQRATATSWATTCEFGTEGGDRC